MLSIIGISSVRGIVGGIDSPLNIVGEYQTLVGIIITRLVSGAACRRKRQNLYSNGTFNCMCFIFVETDERIDEMGSESLANEYETIDIQVREGMAS
jgi:hypothetical protein